MYQQEHYPSVAFALSVIGGIFILLSGLLVAFVGAALTFFIGGVGGFFGLFGVVWGAIILASAFSLRANPSAHAIWGTVIMVFSLISWWGSFGGFFIGFFLSLIGGIMAIVWVPPRSRSAQRFTASAQATVSPGSRHCTHCGRSIAYDSKFCPYCGNEVG